MLHLASRLHLKIAMPTSCPRVNITLEPELAALVADLAKQEGKSLAGFSKALMIEALALREDQTLSQLSESRDIPNTKRISHDDAW